MRETIDVHGYRFHRERKIKHLRVALSLVAGLAALVTWLSVLLINARHEARFPYGVAGESRSYMEANSELNGVVRDGVDELDGGY